MVHRRELNGRVLTFGNEGALYGNAMTWWDHETESLWSQPTAEALVGELAGQRLALYPSALTTWGDWQDSYPDTLALDINTRLTRSGLDLDSMMVAVEIAGTAQAFPIPNLREQGVVNTEIHGISVAVVMQGDQWAVFNRLVGTETVELSLVAGRLQGFETGRNWDPFLGLSTEESGTQLVRIAAFTVFPRDFSTFWPDGTVWAPDG